MMYKKFSLGAFFFLIGLMQWGVLAQTSRLQSAVAWNSDGTLLAIAGVDSVTSDGFIEIWNQSGDTLLYKVRDIDLAIHSISWSPDSTRIAETGGTGVIRIREINNLSTPIAKFTGFNDVVTDIAWSPDGNYLASGSARDINSLKIWDMNNLSTQPLIEQISQSIYALAWSSDSQYLAMAGSIGLVIMPVSQLPLNNQNDFRIIPETSMYSVAWSPDNDKIATGDWLGNLYIYEFDGTSYVFSQMYPVQSDLIDSVAWSPDGTLLASASIDGTLRVFETTNFTEINNYSHIQGYSITSISWFPDPNIHQLAYPDRANEPIIVEINLDTEQ